MGNSDVKVVVACEGDGTDAYLFQQPDVILEAGGPADVLPVLHEVQRATVAGKYAAGYLAYEAGSGLDGAIPATRKAGGLGTPLAWFGIFPRAVKTKLPYGEDGAGFRADPWQPSISEFEHSRALGRIREYLRNGDTYQVNFTFRLGATFEGDPWSLFCRTHRNQRAKYSAFIETDRFAVCSASPELFFSLDGDSLVSRPMKGTSKRGRTLQEDQTLARQLRESPKERAENVMIVDMVRNDMGRIAERDTVVASHMFEVEQYPTVLQMVSTVTCRTRAELPEIMAALFPCASITGAPKIRTMQIIDELETDPRGIYTGCIGFAMPGRRAQFNVAIRTVVVDKATGAARYGVGGGIVWDSEAGSEFRECWVKAGILTKLWPRFDLLETMLWEGAKGYFLVDEHLERLERSAAYFGIVVDIPAVRKRLDEQGGKMGDAVSKVRLLVSEDGSVTVTSSPLDTPVHDRPWRIGFSGTPVDPAWRYLYHKTTNRTVYDKARESLPGYDDVLLLNTRGEVTESTIANVVIEKRGKRFTPPVSSGLLPGVFRNRLVSRGEVEEQVLTVADILNADKLFLINSVRRWIPARLDV